MSDDVNVQATLHYIDKVYAARHETTGALNRAVLVTLIVSVLLVFTGAGLVPAESVGVITVLVLVIVCTVVTSITAWASTDLSKRIGLSER